MRDWLYVLGPIAIVFYFLVNPDQFNALLYWVASLINSVVSL
jgi:hypothetical protein